MKGLREHPKGSGRYEYILRDPKRNPKLKYIRFAAEDYEDAVLKAAERKKQYKEGRYDPWLNVKDDIQYAFRQYMEAIQHMRPSTISNKHSGISLFLRSISVNKFGSVDRHLVQSFIDNQKSAATKRTRLQTIHSFWKWCMMRGFTLHDPIEEYTKSRTHVPREKRTRDAMKLEEYFGVYGFASSFYTRAPHNFFPDFIELGVCTGLRREELIMLSRRDVTLGEYTGAIQIREWTNPKTGEHFVPKHGRERVVQLVPRAVMLLRQLIDSLKSDDPFSPIFPPTMDDKLRLVIDAPTKKFRRSRDEAGLGSSITLHSTRHTYLTWLIVLGVNPYAVMETAGHADLTTQQRYIHFTKILLAQNSTAVKRKLISFLCPGVSQEVLETAFPDSRSWIGPAISFDIMDVLYGGMLYDPILVQQVKEFKRTQSINKN